MAEVRRQDGQLYPPKTTHQILTGLQRYMLDKDLLALKFLDQKNSVFHDIYHACDSVYQKLHRQGVGTQIYAMLLLSLKQKKRSCGLLVLLVRILTLKSLKRAKEPFFTTRGNAFAFVEVKNRGDCAHRCSSN